MLIVKAAGWHESADGGRGEHVAWQPDPGTNGHEGQSEEQHNQRRQKSGTEELQLEEAFTPF